MPKPKFKPRYFPQEVYLVFIIPLLLGAIATTFYLIQYLLASLQHTLKMYIQHIRVES